MAAKKAAAKNTVKSAASELEHPHLLELEEKLGAYLKKTIGKNRTLEHAKKNALKLIKEGQKKTKQEVREIESLIKKHPAAAVLIASAVGAAAGAVAGAAIDRKVLSKKRK